MDEAVAVNLHRFCRKQVVYAAVVDDQAVHSGQHAIELEVQVGIALERLPEAIIAVLVAYCPASVFTRRSSPSFQNISGSIISV